MSELKFIGKHVIKGKIKVLTGLHIGATNEGFQIGGVDNIVIKDPITNKPIIPGSSLKGKIRSLLEWKYAKIEINNIKKDKDNNIKEISSKVTGNENSEFILKLFGETKDWKSKNKESLGPVRLTFRDAFLTDESREQIEKYMGENMLTEVKAENSIDRLTSAANPRFMERVVAGSEFEFEIVMDNYTEEDYKNLKYIFEGMLLLEDSYLGGGGSRGNGKVEFLIEKVSKRDKNYYEKGIGKVLKFNRPVKEIIKEWNELEEKFKF